jgi:hypothetical protein
LKKLRPLLSLALVVSAATPVSAQQGDSAWTIRGGTFAGATVKLNIDLASRRNSKFLRISKLKGDSRFVAWSPSRLPAAVAFRGGRGITAADSIAFWSILREMESDMGMRLFEPATLGSDSDPDDVIVVDTKSMANNDGMTLVTWSSPGGIYDARVFVRSVSTLHNPRVVAHEMMHALGFGHTSAWISIMNSGALSPAHLTLDDVAYAQFAFAQRNESDRSDMWERLALAVDREKASSSICDSDPIVTGSAGSGPMVPAIADPPNLRSCFR